MALKFCILACIPFLAFTSLEENFYRLFPSVLPVHYHIVIKLEADAFATDTFQGEVNITVNISQPTEKIEIYSKNLTVLSTYLQNASTTFNLTQSLNLCSDILTLSSQENLHPGVYLLLITYSSTFNRDSYGLYENTYKNENGDIRSFVLTSMVPIHAREVFPCFDEPSKKATFNLSVVVPKGFTVLSNTLQNYTVQQLSENLEVMNFRTTPLMSSMEIAFLISDFTCDELTDGILYRVCSKPQLQQSRQYALDAAVELMKYFENFTGVPYNVSGIKKIDLVAIPGKGVSSWGMPTFEESSLLWDENSTNFYKQKVAMSISSKFSQTWFGGLVTEEWWSYSFVHQGLSRYFEYFATVEVENEWELDKQFVVEQMHAALLEDSYGISSSLLRQVDKQEDILDKFGELFYSKGASLLRMVEHMVGSKPFQLSLQSYLEKHKFNTTTANDFWIELQSNVHLRYRVYDIIESWIEQPGYPLLNVKLNGTTVIITQEPFQLFNSYYLTPQWYVPITCSTSNKTRISGIWLSPTVNNVTIENAVISKSDWIIFNNLQIGYYRVNYDEDLWNRIASALQKDSNAIPSINRAQIVDDLFNMAKTRKIPLSKVLHLVLFLKNDTDYYPWYAAFSAFADILPRIRNNNIRHKLTNYIDEMMTELYKSAPFEVENNDNQIYSLKQILVVTWACKLNHSTCVENSRKAFSDFRNGKSVPRNLKVPIFCSALRSSNYVERDSYFLWNTFLESGVASEREMILTALSCTPKTTILNKFLKISTQSCSEVQKYESVRLFESIISNNPEGVNITLTFLSNYYEQIRDYYKDEQIIRSLIIKMGKMITVKSQIDKMYSLLRSGNLCEKIEKDVQNAIMIAKKNLLLWEVLEQELFSYFIEKKFLAHRHTSSVAKRTESYYLLYGFMVVSFLLTN